MCNDICLSGINIFLLVLQLKSANLKSFFIIEMLTRTKLQVEQKVPHRHKLIKLHRFVPKSHEFHVMVNMNNICMYPIF
jgi:hypothetical protein